MRQAIIVFVCLALASGCDKKAPAADKQTAMKNACVNNLLQIQAAKQEWALEHGKRTTDTPTADDLKPYIKGNVMLSCPAGGTYTVNQVGMSPQCSIPSHILNPP